MQQKPFNQDQDLMQQLELDHQEAYPKNVYQANRPNFKQAALLTQQNPEPIGIQQQQKLQHYFGNTTSIPSSIHEQKMLTKEDLLASAISEVSSYRPQDLHKRFDKEMHLMIDDLYMPNESMTISSLSQSPWQGTQSYLSNLTSQRLANEGGDSGRLPSVNMALTDRSQSQSKSRYEIQNFIGSSMSISDNDLSENIYGMPRAKPQFFQQNAQSVRSPTNIQQHNKTTNSPEFAKELISMTDDLTVSHTDEDFDNATYRGPFTDTLGQEPFTLKNNKLLRNQNRTFADSVINHHATQMKGTGEELKGNTTVKRGAKSRYEGSSGNGRTEDYEQDLEREDGRPSNATSNNDFDQISDLDHLLTQTQISNNLMRLGKHQNRRADLTRSNITTPDQNQLSRRTNNFQKMDDAESLSFTPDKRIDDIDSNTESQNWFGQKSIIGTKSAISAIEKTTESVQINPVSKLKAKIKEQNILKKGSLSKVIRDQELERALEFNSQPIIEADESRDQASDYTYELIEQVKTLQTQTQALQKENSRLMFEIEKRPLIAPSNELLRARALDAARTEIRELEETVETQRVQIEKLQSVRLTQEDQSSKTKEPLLNQIKQLELQLEKQKIIVSSHKRESEQSLQDAIDSKQQSDAQIIKLKDEFAQSISQFKQKITTLEKTIKQYEVEYNQKADELDETMVLVEEKAEIIKQLETNQHKLQSEVKEYRLKATELEQELDQITQANKDKHQLNADSTINQQKQQVSNFDQELLALKQIQGKELAKLREELSNNKNLLSQAKNQIKVLQSELDKNRPSQPSQDDNESFQVLELIRERLGMHDQDLDTLVANIIEVFETNKLMDHDLVQMQHQLELSQHKSTDFQTQLTKQHQLLQSLKETQESNFTKGLMQQKDQEIIHLKQQLTELNLTIDKFNLTLQKNEDQVWDAQQEIKVAKNQIHAQTLEITSLQQLVKQAQTDNDQQLLIKAVLALDVNSENVQNVKENQTEGNALEHLEQYQKFMIQKMVSDHKRSMEKETALSKEMAKVQNIQLELDQQIKENSRLNDLIAKLEKAEKFEKHQKGQNLEGNQSLLTLLDMVITNQSDQIQANYDRDFVQSIQQKLAQFKQDVLEQEKTFEAQSFSLDFNPPQQIKLAVMLVEFANNNADKELIEFVTQVHQEQSGLLQSLRRIEQSKFLQVSSVATSTDKQQDSYCNHESELEALKEELSTKETNLIQTQSNLNQLKLELDLKSNKLKQLESEQLQSSNSSSQVAKNLDQFKSQIQQELALKTEQLDTLAQELEAERLSLHSDNSQLVQELSNLRKLNSDLTLSIQNKENELEAKEFEFNTKLSAMDTTSSTTKLADDLTKLQINLKDKEKEIKKIKEEQERKLKLLEDKLNEDKALAEQKYKESYEDLKERNKKEKVKETEKAVEKVRSELRNQIDAIKCELAKAKSDWQRERKKITSDHEESLLQQQRDLELTKDSEFRQASQKQEKLWKKRLEEKESHFQQKSSEMEQEYKLMQERHKEEIRIDKERTEARVKETLRIQIKHEVSQQLTQEFTEELAAANQKHQEEVAKLYQQLKQERIINMPLQREQDMTNDMIRMQSPLQKSVASTYTSCMCSEQNLHKQQETEQFIQQLKQNFEQELNRQEAVFAQKIEEFGFQQSQLAEKLVLLECDKILCLISFKKSQTGPRPQALQDVNKKRNQINELIKDILQQGFQLKPGFDAIKRKLSEVLASLKTQIEDKFNLKLQESNKQRNETIQVSETNLVSDRAGGPQRAMMGFEQCECHGNQRCPACVQISPTSRFGHIKSSLESIQTSQIAKSRDFANGYLKSTTYDDEVIIRGSVQDMDNERMQNIVNKVQPTRQNAQGAIVVEVEKVVRDLIMLHRTIRSAKFYRILIGAEVTQSIDLDNEGLGNELDQQKVVNNYRELLNHFFKVIVKLNNAVDELTRNNEVYKLRLLNVELKQQVYQCKNEAQGVVTRQKVDDILTYFQQLQQRFDLQKATKEAVDALEFVHFQISKHQFKLNQLADLFLKEGQLNKDVKQVQLKCQEFASQGGEGFLESTLNVRKSQPRWGQEQANISAEMLSPDETAQLIANVLQKMQKPSLNQTHQIISSNHLLANNVSDISMVTDQPTPQDLLQQALQICHQQSISHQTLSPRTQAYRHHTSNFSSLTQPTYNPRKPTQMPLQMFQGLPPKNVQVGKSYNESIKRSRSLSSNSQQQQFVTLPPNDTNSQYSGYLAQHQQIQSQSIDYQSQQIQPNTFQSLDTNPKSYFTGAQLKPPNPTRRNETPGTISSSLSIVRQRLVANKNNNLPRQSSTSGRYNTEAQYKPKGQAREEEPIATDIDDYPPSDSHSRNSSRDNKHSNFKRPQQMRHTNKFQTVQSQPGDEDVIAEYDIIEGKGDYFNHNNNLINESTLS